MVVKWTILELKTKLFHTSILCRMMSESARIVDNHAFPIGYIADACVLLYGSLV